MDENYSYADGIIDTGMILTFIAFLSVFMLIGIVAQWIIFRKANKPGWASIVPIYSYYVHLKIVGKPGWWLFLLLVPFVNFYILIKSIHLLSRSFGKGVGFTLGLLFLPYVFYPILAFGDSTYEGPYGDPAAFAAYQQQNSFEFEQAT
jgi:hypothetical protein